MSIRQITATITTPNSLSAGVQLGEDAKEIYMLNPGLSTNSVIQFFGSNDGVTYSRICHPSVNSSTVATNPYVIATTATSCWVPIPTGFNYLKVHQTGAASSSASYYIICKI